jgi:hypothetical protein
LTHAAHTGGLPSSRSRHGPGPTTNRRRWQAKSPRRRPVLPRMAYPPNPFKDREAGGEDPAAIVFLVSATPGAPPCGRSNGERVLRRPPAWPSACLLSTRLFLPRRDIASRRGMRPERSSWRPGGVSDGDGDGRQPAAGRVHRGKT